MPTIDDKVVAMSFESSKFESGIAKSISAIDKLKAALTFSSAGKGLNDINKAAENNQLGLIGRAIDSILPKLETLRLVAIGVLSQIATKAVFAGAELVRSFSFDPITGGLQEFATNMNSIQTILANTQTAGTDLEDVSKALQVLNDYSDRTIYNFAQMARNIGTFTAAGVELDVATGAIKGIANLAALSGSSAEQASTAMYQLSQAIAAGRVSLMDWNSVVNAGMGGTVFQRALANTAVQMGTLKENAVDLVGPMKNVSINGEAFRQSLSATDGESWLTSKVLTATLEQFTGDLSKAELAAQGFNKAQIKAIMQTAKTAQEAATEVKTLQGVMQTAQETAVSGWAQTWTVVFGDFNEAKELFTGISEAINGFIKTSAQARNKVLSDWKQLGGRTQLIESFKNVFEALAAVIAPIKEAFREIFPAKTGQDLFRFTSNLLRFTESLKPTPETVELLKRTFKGFFAVLDIGKQILGGIADVFGRVFGEIFQGTGGFLEFTAGVGDFLVKVNEALREGDELERFFSNLGDVLVAPIKMLGILKDLLTEAFSGIGSGGFAEGMGGIEGVLKRINDLWDKFLDRIGGAKNILQPVVETYVNSLGEVGDALLQAIEDMDFDAMVKVIQVGLLGGIVVMFKRFLGKGTGVEQLTQSFTGIGKGIFGDVSQSIRALTGALVAMQQAIKAQALLDVAIAVALLSASIVALSLIDPAKLQNSMTAITVAFGQLVGAMALLTIVTKAGGFIKIPFIAGSMILLAGAILVLSASVAVFSMFSWDELLKGLAGVGLALAIISAAAIPLSANAAGMTRAGIGITAIATGLLILSLAVKSFSDMEWGEMAKGLIGIGVGLGILVGATMLVPRGGMVGIGLGLILVATSLKILANVIAEFGAMDWKTMGMGLGAIAVSLLIIAGAMKIMPKSTPFIAAGLVLVAAALLGIVFAVKTMAAMSLAEIGKGLGTLGAALGILALGLNLMSGAIPGAIALGIAAVALTLLIPPLVTLGSLSWKTIVTGLVALAGAFAVIGVAGSLITPAIPGLLALGAAIFLIGAGLALMGVGITGIAAGIAALVVAVPAGLGTVLEAMTDFSRAMVENAKLFILGLLEIVKAIAVVAPEFVDALIDVVKSIVVAIIQITPMLVDLITVLIQAIIQILDENQEPIIEAAFNLLLALLSGFRDNIGEITTLVIDIITALLTALADNIDKLLGAGLGLLVAFLQGMADNLSLVVAAAANIVVKLISGISRSYGKIISAGADAIIQFVTGIGDNAGRVVTAGVSAVIKFVEGLGKNAVRLANAAGRIILDFLKGLKTAIDTYSPQITEAAIEVGVALIAGVIEGVGNKAGDLYNAMRDIAEEALSYLKKPWKLLSPSRVAMEVGENIIQGLIIGVKSSSSEFTSAITDTGEDAITAMRGSLRAISDAVNNEMDTNPKITPVLDLTQIRSQVQELNTLTGVAPFSASVSLNAASSISPIQPDEQLAAAAGGTLLNFEQNNYSPQVLDPIEIYRQTRNQLSQIKSALAIT